MNGWRSARNIIYEDLDRDEDFAVGAKDVKTHYVPLGINFFHPSGLSASLKGTYVDQDGSFERQDDLLESSKTVMMTSG